jgi:hypothetical protein
MGLIAIENRARIFNCPSFDSWRTLFPTEIIQQFGFFLPRLSVNQSENEQSAVVPCVERSCFVSRDCCGALRLSSSISLMRRSCARCDQLAAIPKRGVR